MKNVTSLLRAFRAQLKEGADPERAVQEKRYLKSPHPFFGVAVLKIRAIAKAFHRNNRDARPDEILDLCDALWARPHHEEKSLGIFIAEAFVDGLEPRHLERIERWVRESTGWAHLDAIAGDVVGRLLLRLPNLAAQVQAWSGSDIFWQRRASVIAHIRGLRTGDADVDVFFDTCDRLLDEKEFFIRKAIGWALREMSKNDPNGVYAFLEPRRGRAARLTLREASKYLDPKRRDRLLAN